MCSSTRRGAWRCSFAALIVCFLISRTHAYGMPRALGWSLLAIVFLGPIVWPWYETWGIVFLALAADAWSRRVVLVLSTVACFATVPAHVTASTTDIVGAVLGLAVVAGGVGSALREVRATQAALAARGPAEPVWVTAGDDDGGGPGGEDGAPS